MAVTYCIRNLLILIIFDGSIIFAQEIILYNFTQNDCSTMCSTGWLLNHDLCTFNFTMYLGETLTDSAAAFFYIKQQTKKKYTELLNIHFESECSDDTGLGYFFCKKLPGNKFNVTMRQKAAEMFNMSLIKGALTTSRGTVESRIQQYPQLSDPKDAIGYLIINKQPMSNEETCNATINVNGLVLEFRCVSSAAPCVIEMIINGSIEKSKNHIFYNRTFENGSTIEISIKFAACRLDLEYNHFNCVARIEFNETLKDMFSPNGNEKSDNEDKTTLTTISALIPLALALVAIVAVFWFRKWICHKWQEICKRKNKRRIAHESIPEEIDVPLRSC